MAVRQFEYAKVMEVMNEIQDTTNEVKKTLAACDEIAKENVGVSNRWSGERADRFKQKWNETAESFNDFVSLIDEYYNKIQAGYEAHKEFEQRD